MSKLLKVLALLFAVALIAAACGNDDDDDGGAAPAPAATEAPAPAATEPPAPSPADGCAWATEWAVDLDRVRRYSRSLERNRHQASSRKMTVTSRAYRVRMEISSRPIIRLCQNRVNRLKRS